MFIADLMPKHPIYTALLPESARAVMGLPHPSGRAAMRMLENEGFVHDHYIDIFDGGPTMHSRTDHVKTIAKSRDVEIRTVAGNTAARAITACGQRAEFRAAWACVTDDGVIDPEGAKALSIEPGQIVQVAPL